MRPAEPERPPPRPERPAETEVLKPAEPEAPKEARKEEAPPESHDLLLPGVPKRLVRLSARSVLRFSLAFYLGLLGVFVVAGSVLWFVFRVAGVIGNIESFMGELLGYEDFHFLFGRILLLGMLIGLVWVVLSAAVTTLLALLYNRVSKIAGGIQVVVEDGDKD